MINTSLVLTSHVDDVEFWKRKWRTNLVKLCKTGTSDLCTEAMNERMESWGRNAVFKDRRCTLERGEKFISTLYFNDINLHSR